MMKHPKICIPLGVLEAFVALTALIAGIALLRRISGSPKEHVHDAFAPTPMVEKPEHILSIELIPPSILLITCPLVSISYGINMIAEDLLSLCVTTL